MGLVLGILIGSGVITSVITGLISFLESDIPQADKDRAQIAFWISTSLTIVIIIVSAISFARSVRIPVQRLRARGEGVPEMQRGAQINPQRGIPTKPPNIAQLTGVAGRKKVRRRIKLKKK